MSTPLEQEFVFKIDSSPVDEAAKAFARGEQGTQDFARSLASIDESLRFFGQVMVGVAEGVSGYVQGMDRASSADREHDTQIKAHAKEAEKAAKFEKQLDDAVKHFAGTAKNTGPFAELTSSIERIGDAASGGVKQLLSGAASAALGFGLYDVGSKIVGFLTELPGKVITASAEAERLDNAFRFSLGPEAGSVLSWIEGIASKTQFTEDQLKGVVLQMTKVGIPASELDKDLAASLDIAAKSANPLEAMSAAVGAFAEGARRGVINMRMLRPLGIGPEALRVLPEFAAMSDKELKKKIEQGNVTREQLLAVVAGADKQLGDVGLKGGDDMESRLKNLRDLPNLLFQQFYTNPAFDVLKAKLGELYDFFAPGGPGGDAVINFIAHTGEAAADWLKGIDFDQVSSDLQDWLEIFSDIWGVTKFVFGTLSDTVGLIEKIVHDFTPIGFLIDKVNEFRGGTAEIKQQNKDFVEHTVKAFAAPADFKRAGESSDEEDDLSFLKPRLRPQVAPGVANVAGHTVTVQNHITVHAGDAGGATADEVGAKVAEHVGKTAGGHFLGALQQARATGGY